MTTVLVLQLDASDPPGRVGAWLRAAGLDVTVAELDKGTDVPAVDEVDGLVVLGGAASANDARLAPVRALLRDAVSAELPTLGICLGAQLLAAAHGGRVERNPDGPEIGAQLVAKRAAASTDPLLRERPITPDVLQWHFDAITVLPPGAIHLAGSPLCEHQAFRLGRLAWGIQFHIETTPAIAREWARADAAELPELDLDLILSRVEERDADIAEAWEPFVHDFAAIVRDPVSVPTPGGIRTSTAAPVTDPAAIRAALAAEASTARLPFPTTRDE